MLRVLLQPVQRVISAVLPTGGTAGQVLRKRSDANNDVEWANPSEGGTNIVDQELNENSANAISNAVVTESLSWHHIQ